METEALITAEAEAMRRINQARLHVSEVAALLAMALHEGIPVGSTIYTRHGRYTRGPYTVLWQSNDGERLRVSNDRGRTMIVQAAHIDDLYHPASDQSPPTEGGSDERD